MPNTQQGGSVEAISIQTLAKGLRTQVQALRRPILEVSAKFGAVREKLEAIAPKVIKLYNAIIGEHEGFTFVEYVRLFDPTVPTHAPDRDGVTGYRNHRTYYTLQYMRRIVQLKNQPRRRGQQGVRDSATDALARTLASMLQVIDGDSAVQLWNAVQSEFGFGERVMTRLRKRVENTRPIITLKIAKPVHVTAKDVVHMERIAPPTAAPLAQPGRNVEVRHKAAARKAA